MRRQSVAINRNAHFTGGHLTLYKEGHTSEIAIKDVFFDPCLLFMLALLVTSTMNARNRFFFGDTGNF
jgi:hypothetical protein